MRAISNAAKRGQQNNDGNGNYAPGFFLDHEFCDLRLSHSVTIDRLEQSARAAKRDMGRQECFLFSRVDSSNWTKLTIMKSWIVADPEHLGGSPRVRDTRISVSLILESLAAVMTISEIVDAYPSLTEEAIRGVLAELAREKESPVA